MKAYLLHQARALAPFARPVAALRLFQCDVKSRLRRQLEKAGYEVVECADGEPSELEAGSLVVHDDVLFSDSFLARFLRSIPDRARNYQCEVDSAHYPALNELAPLPRPRVLPIYYHGAPSRDAAPELLHMVPKVVFQVRDGLPSSLHSATDLCAYFLDFYALRIEHWFDLVTATSLYAREYSAAVVQWLGRFVPRSILGRLLRPSSSKSRTNLIGKNCRIHRSAILEGCVIGDNVEIGPFCRLRCAVVSDGAVVREHSSVSLSFLGEGAYLMGTDVVGSYIGARSAILTRALHHTVFGERSFIGGGSGFADFIVGARSITASIAGRDLPSGLSYLGSAVGDDCFLGANLTFSPGRTIPDGTRILDHNVIKEVPLTPGGVFVRSGAQLLQIPETFLGGAPS